MWRSQIPWTRILAEGAIIVVSILLAFAIQAWWEGSKERAEEQRILAAIRAELHSNVAEIDRELTYRTQRTLISSRSSMLLVTTVP